MFGIRCGNYRSDIVVNLMFSNFTGSSANFTTRTPRRSRYVSDHVTKFQFEPEFFSSK